jgi:hypothetical protein
MHPKHPDPTLHLGGICLDTLRPPVGLSKACLRRVQYWYGVWVYSLNLWLSTVVRTGHSSAPHTLVFCQ